MVMRPGYKLTEVGVIPEDWVLEPLKQLSAFITKGATPTTYGFKWESQGVLFLRSECVSENGLDLTQSMYISPEAHNELRRSQVCDGDLLITITGNVGRVVFLSGVGTANLNQHIAKVRINASHVDAAYVYHVLSQLSVRKRFGSITTGQAYPQISLEQVRDAQVPLPPTKAEQEAIAEALGDADALIESLEQLLVKKRQLKQGAMQELLTGKRRLPGLGRGWANVRLRDLLSYERPDMYIVRDTEYSERGDTPVLTANKSFILGYTAETSGICSDLPAIVFDDFTTASKYVDFPFKVKSSAIKLLRPKHDHVNLRFVYDRMQLIRFPLGDHKRYFISEFQNLELTIPDHAEQLAIAETLSDIDAEIAELEAKLTKARQLRQGMMQELLTGRIRLV